MSDIQSGFEPPVGSVTPPKKGNKIWIFAGVGCLLVSLLCMGGLGFVGYLGMGVAAQMTAAQDSIINSPELQAELGSPLTITSMTNGNEGGEPVISGTVSGPDGDGTYRMVLVPEGTSITTKSITVQANGKTIRIGDDVSEIEEELEGLDLGDGQ